MILSGKIRKTGVIFFAAVLIAVLCLQPVTANASAASSFSISGVTKPSALYTGQSFSVKGTVRSVYKMNYLRAGICTSGGSWKSGVYATVNPKSKKYNIRHLDSKIVFGKLPAGTYYYKIYVKDVKGKKKTVLSKKFTVSQFTVSGVTEPGTLTQGVGFEMAGSVGSKFKIVKARIGIKTISGSWKSGYNVTVDPGSTAYNISAVNTKVKFGSLPAGTYYYKIYVKDSKGEAKYVVSKKFQISNAVAAVSGGRQLSYNSGVISAIGSQQISGPCGIYSMAYCRAVLDGSFSKGSYLSIQSRIINDYGLGTYYAYWYRAGGTSKLYASNSACYKAAIAELNSGKTCILRIKNNNTGNGHYVALIGYVAGTTTSNVSINKFIALDPTYGAKKYLSNLNYADYSIHQLVVF